MQSVSLTIHFLRGFVFGICCLGSLTVVSAETRAGLSDRSRELLARFSEKKKDQFHSFSKTRNWMVPSRVDSLFRAVSEDQWLLAEMLFNSLNPDRERTESDLEPPLLSAQFALLSELRGTYHEVGFWDYDLMERFARDVCGIMPLGSIYLGGSDSGRFLLALFQDLIDRSDLMVLTQNQLISDGYLEYLRLLHGDRIVLPDVSDREQVYRRFKREYDAGRFDASIQAEFLPDGSIVMDNLAGWMVMNGWMLQWLLERNKGKHEIFYEEYFHLPEMHPALEPAGPIMKLNPKPLPLAESVIRKDHAHWNEQIQKWGANEGFMSNEVARKTYARLRTAIGDLYLHHRQVSEAARAYIQSISIHPESPSANYRLMDLLIRQKAWKEAMQLARTYAERMPEDRKVEHYILQIQEAIEALEQPEIEGRKPLPEE